MLVNLEGSALDVGWVSAARWLPYVLLGLVADVFIDAMNRKTLLVVTDIYWAGSYPRVDRYNGCNRIGKYWRVDGHARVIWCDGIVQ